MLILHIDKPLHLISLSMQNVDSGHLDPTGNVLADSFLEYLIGSRGGKKSTFSDILGS